MVKNPSFFNLSNIALLLLCLANILELFIPRIDEGNYFVRMPIQLINGGLLLFMWLVLLHQKIDWTPVTKTVFIFIPLVLIHTAIYAYYNKFDVTSFSGYLKFLLWTTSILFFYEMMRRYGIDKKVLGLYIITFLVAIAKKIIEASKFESDSLGGGDTASLPLLFIIPLVLFCFTSKYRVVLLAFISILVLFSLRRTTMIGFALCLPFIYHYISAKLRFYHLLVIGTAFTFLGIYAWEYIGEAVVFRFENLLVGDKGGSADSYGSGRSEFYLTVWNDWTNKDLFSFVFGNGLTNTSKLLMRVDNIKHAHNDFLEIAHTFGLLGVGIWLWFIKELWSLRIQLSKNNPESLDLFYICFISYIIIAMASGCMARITTLSFGLTVSILLYLSQLSLAPTSDIDKRETQSRTRHYA